MKLQIRFAKFVRTMLTPIRKHLIYRRINKRIKDQDVKRWKKLLLFRYPKPTKGSRQFGVVLGIDNARRSNCCVLRCGCSHLSDSRCLSELIQLHRGITDHGHMLRPVDPAPRSRRTGPITEATQMASGRYVLPTSIDLQSTLKMLAQINGTRPGEFASTNITIKPVRVRKTGSKGLR